MQYLADTVALVRHLRQLHSLGHQARQILQEADNGQHIIYISSITLMEILYLSEKQRIAVNIPQIVQLINHSPNYTIKPVDTDIVIMAQTVHDVPELHDRMIVATAKYLQIPLLTSDHVISQSSHVQVIW